MKPGAIAAIVVGFIVVVGVIVFALTGSSNDDTANTAQPTTVSTDSAPNSDAVSATLTSAEVALHSVGVDCWTIVENNVYDITEYVPLHPGGAEILRACGTDGTTLFLQRTTADGEQIGSGTPHSDIATSQLSVYLLGPLEQ